MDMIDYGFWLDDDSANGENKIGYVKKITLAAAARYRYLSDKGYIFFAYRFEDGILTTEVFPNSMLNNVKRVFVYDVDGGLLRPYVLKSLKRWKKEISKCPGYSGYSFYKERTDFYLENL